MIEISQTTSRKQEKTKIKSRRKSSSVKENDKTFSQELETNITREYSGSIDELLNELKEEEKRFLSSQTMTDLNNYKALVKKILQAILNEGFDTQTLHRSRREKMKGKLDFTVIREIDNKLIAITTAITKKSKAFNLMKTVEEIRGLILDLIY